jgi:hypothetical protein
MVARAMFVSPSRLTGGKEEVVTGVPGLSFEDGSKFEEC